MLIANKKTISLNRMSTCCRVIRCWIRYYHAQAGLPLFKRLARFFGCDGFYLDWLRWNAANDRERLDILRSHAHRPDHAVFSYFHATQHRSVIRDACLWTDFRSVIV